MSQPNLEEIKEVSGLLDKIKQYKELVEKSKVQLEDAKKYYKNQEKIEKQKIQDDIIQKKLLEQLQLNISEYRDKELSQKKIYYKQFSDIFDNYILSTSFKSIVIETIKHFNSSDIEIIVSDEIRNLAPEGVRITNGSQGQLRVSDSKKEYILDPEYLKRITFDRILVAEYSKTL